MASDKDPQPLGPTAGTAAMALVTPASGELVRGVNAQGVASVSIEKVAIWRHKDRCQKTIKKLLDDKTRAAAAVAEAETAQAAAVAAITVPADFLADLTALVPPLAKFFPDAVATDAGGVPLGQVKGRAKTAAADADAPGPSVVVAGSTQYRAEGKVRVGGRDIITLSRMYDLPEAVLTANVRVAEARAVVRKIEADLVESRNQLSRAPEVGELAAAGLTMVQLASSEEGREMLRAADAMVDAIGDEAGLEPAGRAAGTVPGVTPEALAGRQPPSA